MQAEVSLNSRRPLMIALLVAGAFFMENLDGTVIGTAVPQMARSFGVKPVDLNIGMTAYLLALAVFIPISGWLADRFGARTIFGGAIGALHCLFGPVRRQQRAVGIHRCARPSGIRRGHDGAGGAARCTAHHGETGSPALDRLYHLARTGGPYIRPTCRGLHYNLRFLALDLLLNVPLGLLGIVLALLLIPRSRDGQKRSLDWIGFVLTGAACVSLMYVLDLIGRQEIHWLTTGLLLSCSLTLGVASVWHLRRHPHPLIDLSSLRVPTFAVTIWGGSLFRIAIGATPFLLPLMFQIGFGMNAFASGLLILAVFAGNLLMKPATTRVLQRFGFRRVLIVNGLLVAASIFACSLFSASTPKAIIVVVLFAGGLFRSMQFTGLASLGFADIHQSQMSGASTLSSMVQQMTFGMGIAFGAIALRLAGLFHPANTESLTVGDFRIAFRSCWIGCPLGVVDCSQPCFTCRR